MRAVENQALLEQLKWRYATEKFDTTMKISPEDWSTLEQAVIASPSSFGLQPWHFVVVTQQKMKEQLMAASWGQTQLVECSHVVVFTVKKSVDAAYVQKYIDRIAEVRSVPAEKLEGFKGMMVGTIAKMDTTAVDLWSARQTYIALGVLLTSAAMLGIDACPMEGIDPARYDEILGLKQQGLGALMIATLGYRASDDPAAKYPKVRFKAEDVVTHVD